MPMKTSELLTIFKSNDLPLKFILPDGEQIGGDLHITEVKNVHVNSTDCGGNSHSFEETVIQLWKNEYSEREAEWSTTKARNIMDIVAKTQPFMLDTEVFFEFGDSTRLTSKYRVEASMDSEGISLWLKGVATECKPMSQNATACC